jgi:Copper type II ascorbate-dependent monooxygenase, C-terminal domain
MPCEAATWTASAPPPSGPRVAPHVRATLCRMLRGARVRVTTWAASLLATIACGNAPSQSDASSADVACTKDLVLSVTPDVGNADEGYICYGFDAREIEALSILAVRWNIGTGGGATVHHAILYAVPSDFPDGPTPCGGMPPGGVEIHVWSPGGNDLELPSDVGLRLPDGTKRFVLETHLLRTGSGSAATSRVDVCAGSARAREAAFVGMGAPVPAIRPMHEEFSSGSCALAGDVHLWSIWPHMHVAGKEIVGELVRADGSVERLVDVVPWDFTNQRTYPLSVDAKGGDSIRASCRWDNPTATTILPGPRTTDEMCNLAFVAWPAAAAECR